MSEIKIKKNTISGSATLFFIFCIMCLLFVEECNAKVAPLIYYCTSIYLVETSFKKNQQNHQSSRGQYNLTLCS